MPIIPDTPPGLTPDAPIEFGTPSALKSKLVHTEPARRPQNNVPKNPSKSSISSSIFLTKPKQHVPSRAAHAPHDSTQRPLPASHQGVSPSSFPSVRMEYDPFGPMPVNSTHWKDKPLPSFKKKTALIGPLLESGKPRAAPTPIRVPRPGETFYRPIDVDRSGPAFSLSSRSPPKRDVAYYDRKLTAMSEEAAVPYTDPAKATEHFKSFLSGTFAGEVSDDEHANLVVSDVVPGLECRLMPHQIAGLKFLQARESGKEKVNNSGGLLADDMGLGKTVQTMALVVSRPRPTEVESIKTTLVVAPLALVEQWAGEVRSKTKLKVYVHHGPNRFKTARKFSSYDIIMTTYNILVQEYNPATSVRQHDELDENEVFEKRGVFGVRWWRIVLDEAHTIKNRSAKMSVAACALRSVNRWCLTGTPIQNTVDELYSLLKFLRIEPLQDYGYFKEKITSPIARGSTKLAIRRLGAILSKIMIRRTKAILNESITSENAAFKLPPRTVKHIQVDFTEAEREFYTGLRERADKVLARMRRNGEMTYIDTLVLLQRLRQACNHAQLVTKELDASEYKVDVQQSTKKEDPAVQDLADMFSGVGVSPRKESRVRTCAVCQDELDDEDQDQTHCKACAKALSKTRSGRSARSREEEQEEDEEEEDDEESTAGGFLDLSAKLSRVLHILRGDEEPVDNEAHDPRQRKTIIFSQWTAMLDLVEPFLRAENIGYKKYYGSMANKQREAALESLKTDPHCHVLLCSLKAGALGLNLTAASRVVMLDVWWNPAIEDQAIDRVHRIGQTREVLVYKLTVKSTVEDRILELQEAKRDIAKSALGEGGKMMQLGMKELLDLFR